MSITAIRADRDARRSSVRRLEDRTTRRQLAEAMRANAELQAGKEGLAQALQIEQAENTRLAQEIANLRRALRLAEARLDPR